jgi:hypothetical protein
VLLAGGDKPRPFKEEKGEESLNLEKISTHNG